jgi:CBS domain-containing protein
VPAAIAATAADVMTPDPITVREDWTLGAAADVLARHGISGAPVLDRDGDLVGVISVTDLAHAGAIRRRSEMRDAEFYRTELEPVRARAAVEPEMHVVEAMTPTVIDAPEDLPVARLAAIMIDLHVHRVIITRDRRPVGIVTSTDLLRLVRDASGATPGGG